MRHLLRVSLLLSLVACNEPTAPDGVGVRVANQRIEIVNTSDEPVYTMAMDEDLLALADWIACVTEQCGRILPGETRRLTYEEVGSAPGRTVRLYYWRAVYDGGFAPVPGPITQREIRLPRLQFP
jgi:hypothetical protein